MNITEENIIIQPEILEDVWDPASLKIVSTVKRFSDPLQPFLRYDVHNQLLEKYKLNFFDTTLDKTVKDLYDLNLFPNEYMTSETEDNVITDYYFSHKIEIEPKIPYLFIHRFKLKQNIVNISNGALIRYNTNKELVGAYYGGAFDPLVTTYYQHNQEFVETLKSYYNSKLKTTDCLHCLVKDFGNNACYVIYAQQ